MFIIYFECSLYLMFFYWITFLLLHLMQMKYYYYICVVLFIVSPWKINLNQLSSLNILIIVLLLLLANKTNRMGWHFANWNRCLTLERHYRNSVHVKNCFCIQTDEVICQTSKGCYLIYKTYKQQMHISASRLVLKGRIHITKSNK